MQPILVFTRLAIYGMKLKRCEMSEREKGGRGVVSRCLELKRCDFFFNSSAIYSFPSFLYVQLLLVFVLFPSLPSPFDTASLSSRRATSLVIALFARIFPRIVFAFSFNLLVFRALQAFSTFVFVYKTVARKH